MKRFILALFVLCALSCTKNPSTEVKIGIIASLNGPAGEQGKNWMRGAQLAAEDARKEGIPVRLSIEDDQTETSKVVAAFTKLVEVNGVQGMVGGTWDFLGEAAYPLAKRYKIPFVTPSNPPEVLSDAAKKSGYVFSNSMTLASMRAAVKEFLLHRGAKSIGIMYPDLPFGTQQAAVIKDIAQELKLPIVYDYEFSVAGLISDTVKLASLRIEEKKPDFTYAVLDYNYIDLLTSEFKAHSFYPSIITTQHLDTALTFSKDPARYRSMYAVYPRVSDEDFNRAFTEKFKEAPRVYAAHGYDAATFLIKAIHAHINFGNPETQFRYDGITGEHLLPAKESQLVETEAVIMSTESGTFQKAK